ncbi:hypothetical protein OPU71_01725 [Niveibacterium sp. 24ML]|uniref:hypothetical protein n=1 Tax=Niveibacterium sp. 24ML TaxID=2985512 RepID=UPI002270085E|nr:hypothetical protein [Niveibacterium sp. 24ML]MCX9154837.1 hypothetical protein [Niveibacterium sp. 24ML]
MKRASEDGFALPILLILLTAVTIFVANRTLQTFGGFDLRASLRTDMALRNARHALIQYAAWEDTSPGSLPCPDFDNDGDADLNCASNAVGRFPWKTLGVERPSDGNGECLWYAISPKARNTLQAYTRGPDGTQPAINPSYQGELSVLDASSGVSAAAIAVIVAPGTALQGQSRTATPACSNGPSSAFLESRAGISNAAGGPAFVTSRADPSFNDRVLPLTADALFVPVRARVAIELAGRTPAANSGLRYLFAAGNDAGSYLASDGSGRLALDFHDPQTLAAFSPPLTGTTTIKGACTHYDAGGNPTAEWLCFNRWLEFTQYTPVASDSARLALAGWQTDFSITNPPRLKRTQ